MYDTIIIGSGPSGVSAAVYLKRSGFDVLVLSTNDSALKKAIDSKGAFVVSTTVPSNTRSLWIDTSSGVGSILKYYNGSSWVATNTLWA